MRLGDAEIWMLAVLILGLVLVMKVCYWIEKKKKKKNKLREWIEREFDEREEREF